MLRVVEACACLCICAGLAKRQQVAKFKKNKKINIEVPIESVKMVPEPV